MKLMDQKEQRTSLESALDEATQKIKIDQIKPDDIKIKAKILKSILVERRICKQGETLFCNWRFNEKY